MIQTSPYAFQASMTERSTAGHRIQVRWGLVVALALNVATWAAIIVATRDFLG